MKKQGFLKGSAILLGMVLITKAIGLIYKIPLTHMLGGSGMAYFSGAFAVFSPLLAAVVSGISASVARLTAEGHALGRFSEIRKVRRCALLLYTLISLAAAAVYLAAAYPLAVTLMHDQAAFWPLCALAPMLVFSAVLSAERGYYEGLMNMLPTARSEVAETVLKALFGLAGTWAVFSYAERSFADSHGCFGQFFRSQEAARAAALPYAAAAAILGSSLATGLAALYIAVSGKLHGDGLTDEMLRRDPVTDSSRSIMKRLLCFSMPIAGAAVITTLTGMIDLVTIPRGLGRAIASGIPLPEGISAEKLPDFIYGSYTGLALMISGLVPTFTAMFGKSSLPSLAEARSKGDKEGLAYGVRSLIRISLIAALPCGAAIAVLPRETLSFLFAGRSAEIECTVRPLGLLGIACVFTAAALPCLSALQTIGCWRTPMLLMPLGGALKLAGNLLLIPLPQLGVSGAALSTLISQAAVCILAVSALLRETGTSLQPGRCILRPCFAALLCSVTARLMYDTSAAYIKGLPARISFIAAASGGAFVYFLSLWLMNALPKEQLKRYFLKKIRKNY